MARSKLNPSSKPALAQAPMRPASQHRFITSQLQAAAQIEDVTIRQLVIQRIQQALQDPLADARRTVNVFAALSAASVRLDSV
jgi:hypothetical protein